MKQEFVTLYGKAIVEREILYLRSPYLPFSKTAFAQIGYGLVFVLWFVLYLLTADRKIEIIVSIVIGALVLSRFSKFYDVFFRRSYASRIPLSRIRSITIEDDEQGLQTEVRLWLANGRYKKVVFRKLENQVEPFLKVLSAYSIHLKLAA